MPHLSFLDENCGNIFLTLSSLDCLVNVSVFPFKVHRCNASFFFLSQKHRIALNFPLDFLLKKGKVRAFFIIYLIKKMFILLFPKTILFWLMLLVC